MHAHKVTTPFLIMHGTADPTVGFENGLGFYNALRYNGKKAVLLAYPNEGHGLRGMANRKDLTVRYFQFFDHCVVNNPRQAIEVMTPVRPGEGATQASFGPRGGRIASVCFHA